MAGDLEGIDYNITSIIDILGLVQGLFLGTILIIEAKKKVPTLFLGFFLVSYSFELLNAVLEDLDILTLYPRLLFIPIEFLYLTVPLFYIYAKKITGSTITTRRILYILLPGIIEFIMGLVIFLLPIGLKIELWEAGNILGIIIEILELLAFPYSIYYIYLTLRLIKKNKKDVEDFYSNTEGKLLNWAKGVMIFVLTFNLLWFIEIFQEDSVFDTYTYPILSAINVVFIFWIGISGLRQIKIIGSNDTLPENILINSKPESSNTEKEAYNDADYLRMTQLVIEEKYYKEPNMSLSDISKVLGLPQRKVSRLIKKNTDQNFNQFINFYRVEEAKRLLRDGSNDKLSMLGIAHDAGFSSKASFFSVFKKHTGLTPNTYRNQAIRS